MPSIMDLTFLQASLALALKILATAGEGGSCYGVKSLSPSSECICGCARPSSPTETMMGMTWIPE